ncbi:MAG: hypothetical protein QXF17_04550 [Ignisphaera sp.]
MNVFEKIAITILVIVVSSGIKIKSKTGEEIVKKLIYILCEYYNIPYNKYNICKILTIIDYINTDVLKILEQIMLK